MNDSMRVFAILDSNHDLIGRFIDISQCLSLRSINELLKQRGWHVLMLGSWGWQIKA